MCRITSLLSCQSGRDAAEYDSLDKTAKMYKRTARLMKRTWMWSALALTLTKLPLLQWKPIACLGIECDAEESSNSSSTIPQSPRIYFIHVGKAGGTTLTRALMLDNTTVNGDNVAARAVRCTVSKRGKVDPDGNIMLKIGVGWKDAASVCYKHPPGASELTRRTLGVFHMQGAPYSNEEKAWLLHNTNLFLFTLRDPIERLVSTYYYHRNQFTSYYSLVSGFPQLDKFYSRCFPKGLDVMINDLRNGSNVECLTMGVKFLLGKISDGEEHSEFNYEYYWKYALDQRPNMTDGREHFKFNYEYYWNYALGQKPNRPVAVLRTEHLWEDVIHLDQVIGGTGNFSNVEGFKFSHGSEKYSEQQGADIGTSNTVFLCCLISREIEFYQLLILKASNLSDKQKRESLYDLLNRCHIETPSENVLKHPFSWRLFRQGEMCSDLLGNVVRYYGDPYSE